VQRRGFLSSRWRGLAVLATVGGVNVLATAAVDLMTAGSVGSSITRVLSLRRLRSRRPGAVRRVLTPAHRAHVTTRQVLPGAVVAAGCWLGLQALGGGFVTQVLAGSSQTYGGFAAVAGLLSWLLIAAELILIAAELNVVLARRLWPRSLTGELLEADKQALRHLAQTAQLDPRQDIAVSFTPGGLPNQREADQEQRPDDHA
jgi:hypothetical protein